MPHPCQVVRSPLELIGATPVVQLQRVVSAAGAEVWAKLESLNPGGSIKDRICLGMIEEAERDGRLKPGDTIVEPTSGNTGIGLAMVAAVKGYRLILTMPDTMSEERRGLLAAYGAEVVLTPDTKGMHGAVEKAAEIAASRPGSFTPQQFQNPANPAAHRQTTAREILSAFPTLDAFVTGVGTGGTITGVGNVLRARYPDILICAVEPASSQVLSGSEPGYHKQQGLGAGFVPSVLDTTAYDEVVAIRDDEAEYYTRRLAREEGILVGVSSGATCAAALQIAQRLGNGKIVLTVFSDTGSRYLTTDLFSLDEKQESEEIHGQE